MSLHAPQDFRYAKEIHEHGWLCDIVAGLQIALSNSFFFFFLFGKPLNYHMLCLGKGRCVMLIKHTIHIRQFVSLGVVTGIVSAEIIE